MACPQDDLAPRIDWIEERRREKEMRQRNQHKTVLYGSRQRRQDMRHNYVTRLHTFNTSILALVPFTQVY